MAPILGIIASGNYAGANASSYESIATTTVGSGGASSITFSSIPSTYKHLQIRFIARNDVGGIAYGQIVSAQFNSDTGSNYYSRHSLDGRGDGLVYAGNDSTATYVSIGFVLGDSGTANTFSPSVVDILDYTSTNKHKTVRFLTGVAGQTTNTNNDMVLGSGLWKPSTDAAITDIVIKTGSANFKQYSHFALYGIKG